MNNINHNQSPNNKSYGEAANTGLLSKAYDPKETEKKIYDLWLQANAFQPKVDDTQRPFTIAIPPPNVTGNLHMGHALNNTIQDILIRRSRMRGVPTLWIPGTDHGGIATQNVVEKKLTKEGLSRQELAREKLTTEIHKWVDEYGHIIIDQLKAMGCSCDWSRQRFTMDDEYSEAVNFAFKHYYDKGWIYEGERVVNWCVRCQTALSDIEVEHTPQKAKLYYFKYDKDFPITIATTRPETKLGDVAVAVNPKDKRYEKYIGQTFKVNFVGVKRDIKIIADRNIDMKFGTGALGVTPAHSIIDAEMAEKNDLPIIKVIDQYGKVTPQGCDFQGLKVAEAQEKIIEKLKADGLLEKEEEIENNLAVCYRCGRPIEPQPSKQWFLKMSELAKPAIEAVKNGDIKFVPERWNKVYLTWMENLKDWCISRQIVWGHRLPVFEKPENVKAQMSNVKTNTENDLEIRNSKLEIYVGSNPPEGYEQSSDVLDTWFSSALWPFATLGWPQLTNNKQQACLKATDNKTNSPQLSVVSCQSSVKNDLSFFYPTNTLCTARDIIYLWVARMIFSGFEFMKEKPFSTVYIHPTILNKEGKRMSKSLGTGVDPLELIDKYGADATRFGLTYINTGIQDIRFDENAILAGQKFGNKIWNISRFVLQNASVIANNALRQGVMKQSIKIAAADLRPRNDADKKILDQLNSLINSVNSNLDEFKFGQAAHDLYDFVWHDFADEYIEESKKEKNDEILLYTLMTTLKLLHPFMPFLTEEIWQTLYAEKLVDEKLLITASWPVR